MKEQSKQIIIRFAKESELVRVNELRKQVNDLHVEGKPEIFRAGFNDELRDFIYKIWKDPEQKIVVAELNGVVCGFAVLHHIHRPGIATKMMSFIRNYTKEKGIERLELNMWEFNQDALAFYPVLRRKPRPT